MRSSSRRSLRPELAAKIRDDLAAALKQPAVAGYLKKNGATPVASSPRDFDVFMLAEADKWAPIIKSANIKAE